MAQFTPEISASLFAGFVGLHKYKTQDETFFGLLQKDKTIRNTINNILTQQGRMLFDDAHRTISKDPYINAIIRNKIEECKGCTDLQPLMVKAGVAINKAIYTRHPSFTHEIRKELVQEAVSQIYKRRGLANENTILDNHSQDIGEQITERNTKMMRKDMGAYRLIGRIDGWVESKRRVVDSKERKSFVDSPPLYDEIQMRVYMILMDANEAELVERFPDGTVRKTLYANDPEKWNELHQMAVQASELIREIAVNKEKLEEFVTANSFSAPADKITNGGNNSPIANSGIQQLPI